MQTAQHVSHALIVQDFRKMLQLCGWTKYFQVTNELQNLKHRGRIAVSPTYQVHWFLDEDVTLEDPQSGESRIASMRVDIGGERLALKLKPDNGVAVWRLVDED